MKFCRKIPQNQESFGMSMFANKHRTKDTGWTIYSILFCHKIQYIISTERNELIYIWATLGFIDGPTRNSRMLSSLPKKSSLRRKPIFILLGTLISKIILYLLFSWCVRWVWFQQDRAICHRSHATIDLLHQTFDIHTYIYTYIHTYIPTK